ncbi:MAG: DUF3784 domain-containing protein [Romboutsia sp.]
MSELYWGVFSMSAIFLALWLIFLIFKSKSCVLIGGYNTKSKEERKHYDEETISKDYAKFFFKCGMIFLLGGIGCILISNWCFGIAFIIWITYFFKNVSCNYKIFEKYRKN